MDAYANLFPNAADPIPGTQSCQCWQRMGIVYNSGNSDTTNQSSLADGLLGFPWWLLLLIAGGVVLLSNNSDRQKGV